MIRIDAVWLSTAPLDMRAGTDTALARVVAVFGAAHPHTAYLFANRRANRMKVLVHDGIGVWLAARRLNSGKFVWPKDTATTDVTISGLKIAGDPNRVCKWLGLPADQTSSVIDFTFVAPHGTPGLLAVTFDTPAGPVTI